jgi:GNAT superfamily N-acetyltransferase
VSQPIAIVRGQLGDIPQIAGLAEVIWRACYPAIISTAQIDYMLQRMYDPEVLRREMAQGVVFFLARTREEPIGFASCGPGPEPRCFKLHKLYVLPEFQGCGAGGALLREVEQCARDAGADTLVLNVNKKNEQAIRVYQRRGFSLAESVVVDIGNGFVMDDFVMRKTVP